MVSSGVKDLALFSTGPSLVYAARTVAVLAKTRMFGPAAARSSFRDATLSRLDVGRGSAFDGHGVGSSLSFISPAIVWNPTA